MTTYLASHKREPSYYFLIMHNLRVPLQSPVICMTRRQKASAPYILELLELAYKENFGTEK